MLSSVDLVRIEGLSLDVRRCPIWRTVLCRFADGVGGSARSVGVVWTRLEDAVLRVTEDDVAELEDVALLAELIITLPRRSFRPSLRADSAVPLRTGICLCGTTGEGSALKVLAAFTGDPGGETKRVGGEVDVIGGVGGAIDTGDETRVFPGVNAGEGADELGPDSRGRRLGPVRVLMSIKGLAARVED